MSWKTENEKKFEIISRDFLERELHRAIGKFGRLYKSEAHARAAMKRKGLHCVSPSATKPCILETELEYRLYPERKPEHPLGKLRFERLSTNNDDPANAIIVVFRTRK